MLRFKHSTGPAANWPAWTDEVAVTLCRARIEPHGRNWAVYDDAGALVCLCVYKRGALEVLRRLQGSGEKL